MLKGLDSKRNISHDQLGACTLEKGSSEVREIRKPFEEIKN